jgi:hypothetical protein
LVNQYNATLSTHAVIKDSTLWIGEQPIKVTRVATNIGGTLASAEASINSIGSVNG